MQKRAKFEAEFQKRSPFHGPLWTMKSIVAKQRNLHLRSSSVTPKLSTDGVFEKSATRNTRSSFSPALMKNSVSGIVCFKAPIWSTTKPANPPLYRTPPLAATMITIEFKTTRLAATCLSGGAGKLFVGRLSANRFERFISSSHHLWWRSMANFSISPRNLMPGLPGQ